LYFRQNLTKTSIIMSSYQGLILTQGSYLVRGLPKKIFLEDQKIFRKKNYVLLSIFNTFRWCFSKKKFAVYFLYITKNDIYIN